MVKRVNADLWTGSTSFPDYKGADRGKLGKIKRGNKWREKTVMIMNNRFNKGSVIDAVNRKLPDDKKLKKGFLGIRATPDKIVIKAFYDLYHQKK